METNLLKSRCEKRSFFGFIKYCFVLLLIILLPNNVKADHDYNDGDVSVSYDYSNGWILIHYLGYDDSGIDDELDDCRISYLDTDGQYKFLCHIDAEWGHLESSEAGSEVVSYDDGDWISTYWKNIPARLLGTTIMLKIEVDWDVDCNDNHSGYDFTCYKTITATSITTPSSFTVSQNECNTVKLDWVNPATPIVWDSYWTNYKVEIYRDNSLLTTLNGNTTTYSDNSVDDGTVYSYKIRALLTTGLSQHVTNFTSAANGNSQAQPVAPVLDNPVNYQCNKAVQLSWTHNGLNVSKFVITRSTTSNFSGDLQTYNITTTTDRSFTDNNVTHGQTYYYKIKSVNKCDEGNESAVKSINTNFSPTPIGLIGAYVANGKIRVHWTYHCGAVTSLKLTKKTVQTGVSEDITLNKDSLGYTDGDVDICKTYRYTLKASNTYGDEASTPVDTVVHQDMSSALRTLSASKGYYSNKIILQWSADYSNLIDQYQIKRRKYGSTDAFSLVKIIESGSTFLWTEDNSDPGIYYEYSITGIATCGGSQVSTNTLTDIGFRQPAGIVGGQISYEGGTAVANVRVNVGFSDASKVMGNCLYFNGHSFLTADHKTVLDFSHGFTAEMWTKPDNLSNDFKLFHKGNYGLLFSRGSKLLRFNAGPLIISYNIVDDPSHLWEADNWNHVAVTADASVIKLYINGKLAGQTSGNGIITNTTTIYTGEQLNGFLDEIRVWKVARSADEIKNYYTIVASGEESNLVACWHLDENLGTLFFDCSKQGDTYNEVHGTITLATWSDAIPSQSKLALCGLTQADGTYLIKGIRFTGNGSTFKITPVFGQHTFDPLIRNIYVSESSLVYNSQDFTDKSSFTVTGNVKYNKTNFPVKDVYIKVDGNYVMGKDNMPKTTDALGNFNISVPIGEHFVSAEKANHTFVNSYFPPKAANGDINKYDFQEAVSGLQFLDDTRVKVAGRIVGGTREGDKTIGFGKSVNNIGVVTVNLTTEKGYDLDTLQNENSKNTNFITNAITGEYEVLLLPEKYTTVSVGNAYYSFTSGSDLCMLDLTGKSMYIDETDSVFHTEIEGEKQVKVFDSIAHYYYHYKKNWIYRTDPKIDVKGQGGSDIISDQTCVVGSDTIQLFDIHGDNVFDYPIYTFRNSYTYNISVFEEYKNNTNNVVDKVPVTDGQVIIRNDIGLDDQLKVFSLDSNGMVKNYRFMGGFPNISEDALAPENSYTKTLSIKAQTPSGKFANWPATGTYRAYVLGSKPTGNNFVSTGPNKVDFILRDPPGSNSSASFEKGFTTSKTNTISVSNGNEGGGTLKYVLGSEVETEVGSPLFQIKSEFQIQNNIGITFDHSEKWSSNDTKTESTTYGNSFSTSSDPAYVGAMGDVFFGYSTNIIYGISRLFEIMPVTQVVGTMPRIAAESHGYTIAQKNALRVNPEISTTFVYTQDHIENYLIPNLKLLRELQFENHPDLYQEVFTDTEDDKYHTNNLDPIWGTNKKADSLQVGPSYIFHALAPGDSHWHEDSVRFFNNQIEHWMKVLEENEKEKTEAVFDEYHKNISFDAGSKYQASIQTETTSTTVSSFEWTIAPGVATEIGFSFNGFGFLASLQEKYTHDHSEETENTETHNTTVGFSLDDGDQGDYYTVDVKKCVSGNGPVFITRGGQTSCPYEGEKLTKYYQSGQFVLSYATMQIEVPKLTVLNPIASNVPENKFATYTLNLLNESEVGADNWFILVADAASNPYGAKLMVDGMPIADGISILVPAGKTVTKTLQIAKGRDDVNDYENINVILHSICQFDPTDDVDDIADTVSVSAHFIPACTEVAVNQPLDKWVVNVSLNDTLPIKITNYDLNQATFDKVDLQYKNSSSSMWITMMSFFNKDNKYDAADQPKNKISGQSSINYKWDMTSLQDREYQIRAVSVCSDGSRYESDVISGVLDGKRPKVFGTPQPADGVLSPNDEIMIQFDEPIEAGLLTNYNFEVKGVLNGNQLNHGTSVAFDGNDYGIIGEGIQLSDHSYTIEFWMQKATAASGVVFSQGVAESSGISIGFDNNNVFVNQSGSVQTAASNCNDGKWHHWAFIYSKDKQLLSILSDVGLVLEATCTPVKDCTGRSYTGKQSFGDTKFLTGNVHEMRIWDKDLPASDISSKMNIDLSGYERGLLGYWPMDDANGTLARDKVHSRNMELSATWLVLPASTSYAFNGTDQALSFKTGTIPITNEMDFTLEFWFKGNSDAYNTYLFSNGDPACNLYDPAKVWNIKVGSSGELIVENNSQRFTASSANYFNDNWHHFALVMNKLGNITSFVDGELQASAYAQPFGGIEGEMIFVGARGYKDNARIIHLSNYYKGNIDEVRVWDLARTQKQIVQDMNHQVASDEFGLMAYFPFETYTELMGTMVSTQTLTDQSLDLDSRTPASHCGTMTVYGAQSYSTLTPNIKRARPKQSVNYDFTVNTDKIIITPTDPAAVIEKCLLEITVKGIEDLHGNRLASPATWTAFVNKNQVNWTESEKTFEKQLYNLLTFTMTISNTGGKQENYSIENLPAWLTAEPQRGVIDPLSTQKVTFTVNEGLNIGNYNQDIYMSTGMGFQEKFLLNLRVFKPAPDWQVDPSKFTGVMNIIGKVKINGIVSSDPYDKIAAFVGAECRGVANLKYIKTYDCYEAFLDIYGSTDMQDITFKVWDASDGIVYTDITPTYKFMTNAIYGTPSAPILFTVNNQQEQLITLNEGWNWLSFNLNSADLLAVGKLFNGLNPKTDDELKCQDGSFDRYMSSEIGWVGTLTNNGGIKPDKMYMAHISNAGNLIIRGERLLPDDVRIVLKTGWNWIGYLPWMNMKVDEALANFNPSDGDVIKAQTSFAMYDRNLGWIGTLQYMQAGVGYMYRSAKDTSFVYPKQGMLKSAVAENEKLLDVPYNVNQYKDYSSIVAKVMIPASFEFDEDFKLAAYDDNECFGMVKVKKVNNDYLFFLPIYTNYIDKDYSLKLLGKDKQYKIIETIRCAPGETQGTLKSPVMLTITGYTKDALADITPQIYPNPFSKELTINFTLNESKTIKIEIINIVGVKVATIFKGIANEGQNTIKWNGISESGETIMKGQYLLKVVTDTGTLLFNIVKID
jgi:hypothetical protein